MVAKSRVTGLLDRILDSVQDALTPELARAIVALRLDKKTQETLDDFAERHHESQLTPDELVQYDSLINAISLISVLQAKARSFLKSQRTL